MFPNIPRPDKENTRTGARKEVYGYGVYLISGRYWRLRTLALDLRPLRPSPCGATRQWNTYFKSESIVNPHGETQMSENKDRTEAKYIAFRFKSGYECVHTPSVNSEDEWWGMVSDIMLEMNKSQSGIFITKSPFGIHRLTDVEAVHFGDIDPPENVDVPSLGFVK